MSAVEAAPSRPPPRPTHRPSMPEARKTKETQLEGYSKDLESINFSEPFEEEEDGSMRRRSMTLDSQSSHRHSNKRSSTQPHIIDSSKGSPRLSKSSDHRADVDTQEKPKHPASSSKPSRPPPPLFGRSASQPQTVKNSVGGASRGEDAVGRRPPSADSAISRSRTPPVTLHRLSSSVGSRESSPLPDVPEDESDPFHLSPSHGSQPATPTSPQITPTSPNATPTRHQGAPPPRPPSSQVPARPVRPKSPFKSGKAAPNSAQSPPFSPPPSFSDTHPIKLCPPSPQETTPPVSPPLPESPSSIPEARSDSSTPPPHRGISPPGRPPFRGRSSTSPCIMVTDREKREREEEEDGTAAGMNYLSTSKGIDRADSNLPASSAPTTNATPSVPPRPFLPPRPFPPNSRPEHRPHQARRVTDPGITPIRPAKKNHHGEKGRRETSTATNKVSPSKSKRGTRHHSPRHPPRPSHDPSTPLNKDPDKNSPARNAKTGNVGMEQPLSEQTAADGSKPPMVSVTGENGTERQAEVASDSADLVPSNVGKNPPGETPHQSGDSQESVSVFKKKQLKFVSFRSRESIVNDSPLQRQDTVEEVSPMEPPSPTKGRKLVNSMKKSFRSLRIKKQKSPSASPESLKRCNSDDVGVCGDLVELDERYPDPLPQGMIDPIVVQCVAYLNKESVLLEEGLFRVPGDLAAIRRLRQNFMHGHEVNLAEVLDPHTVAGLLKLHFREQKTSLIPRGPPLTVIMDYVRNRDVEGVSGQLTQLEVITMATLSIVVEMLAKVTSHSSTNMMTAGTLAMSCGPSLFPYLPPSSANQIVKFLIDNCSDIFHPNTPPARKDKFMKELWEEEEEKEEDYEEGAGDEFDN